MNTIQILGTGHSESIDRNNSSFMIKNDNGNLLIDCGYTIKYALHAQNMNIQDIDGIFITHVHGDHVFGLERVAYESLFKYQKKIDLIFHEDIYEELWEQTLKGSLSKIGEGNAEFSDYFNLIILKKPSFELYGNRFQIFNVCHTPNKPAFGFNMNEKLFYSGDTTAIPLEVKRQKFDIGIHDVTLADTNPVHATLNSLIQSYPLDIRKKLLLTSYEDSFEKDRDIVESSFKGFATEGMTINI